MQEILDNFLTITKIARCSFHADKMELFLKEFAKEHGYGVKVDKAKNILVYAKEPKICLQAHYDMVCVGKAPDIEVVQEDNILRAKESSLGADNGIAIAMMMQLIKEGAQLEFLFSSDEEVGLIGAKNLELPIKSKYLLNLDSEDEAEVYIGCAGGVDLKLTKELTPIEQKGYCYEVSIKNLPGGHSGVDIDKGIPNAITNLAAFIKKHNAKIALFSGGERINSIPANASAAIVSEKKLHVTDGVELIYVPDNAPITEPHARSEEPFYNASTKYGKFYFQEEGDSSEHFNLMFDKVERTDEVMVAKNGIASGITPKDSNDRGKCGEIIIDREAIYICVEENHWRKIELEDF